jgi:hypothetical protein
MVVGTATLVAGAACRAHHTSGYEGVPTGLVVGGVHLVDGGDGVAASGELHMLSNLHFAYSKEMLRCAKTHVASVHFKCFGCLRGTYVAIVSDECCKSISECCIYFSNCICMLYKSVPNVSFVFLDVLLQVYLSRYCVSHI